MNIVVQRAIEIVGGAAPLARTLGVTTQAVCFWRDNKRQLPIEHCPFIEEATNGRVRCEELRSDKVDFFRLIHRQAERRVERL